MNDRMQYRGREYAVLDGRWVRVEREATSSTFGATWFVLWSRWRFWR